MPNCNKKIEEPGFILHRAIKELYEKIALSKKAASGYPHER